MISNCGHDENGKYSGGTAGDQTGTEWQIISWYSRPWNVVLRYPDLTVGNDLAYLGTAAANNDLIGYDQSQRETYWQHLKASNYDPAQITVACEADCSSGVAANVKAAGYRLGLTALQNVSSACYTGNLRSALVNAGFEALTDSKYLTSDKYLLPGDILLYEGHHTATNLDTGSEVTVEEEEVEEKKSGWYQEDDGWRFYLGNTGECVRNAWYQDGDNWYWFDGAGIMVSNVWYQYNGYWYYLGADGAMVKGLQSVDGKWYYLDQEGKMATEPVTLTPDQDGALQYPGLAE